MSQASLSGVVFVLSRMLVRMLMNMWVNVPLSTEQLFSLRMLCLLQVCSILLVIILVKSFLAISIKTMGLVTSTFLCQFLGFGIRMVFVFFHVLGIFL